MKHWMYRFAVAAVLVTVLGCGGKPASSGKQAESEDADSEEEKLSPEEQRLVDAASPFVKAIASRQYDAAYGQLSSHARARMSLNQFDPSDDDAEFEKREKEPMVNVSSSAFAELMTKVEIRHGTPQKLLNLHIHTTDAAVLARQSKEEFGAVDSMFAIGAMPDSIPFNIRKASLRGQVGTQLSSARLAEAAKAMDMTVSELTADPDFQPYFTVKVVLVEENGALKVGYFEFLPPSMMD